MDLAIIRSRAASLVKRYRYVFIILAAGFILMMLPKQNITDNNATPTATQAQERGHTVTANELTKILEQIRGVGKAEVLLTCSSGETVIYQSDQRHNTSDSNSSEEYDTVILTDSSRGEGGMIKQVLGPEYLGAVVVCQGADDPAVRLAVSEAVGKATGLGSNRISVLKMK